MTDRPLRVAVWSTGGIGSIAIRTLHQRPGHDLVGVWVHSADKVGKDAGVLAGGDPIGVAATNDVDSLLALRPDCIVYAASAPDRESTAVPDYVRFLKAGVNVVSTSTSRAVYPPTFEPWRAQLEEAAEAGGASFYVSGLEPGFAADQLPLALATQSSAIRSVYAAEIAIYDDYPVKFVMMDAMGFGLPLDSKPLIATPGSIAGSWGSSLHLMADAFGLKLDEVRESYERVATDRTLEVACGTIEAGTCGAMRIRAIGIVEGREALIVEHVNRMARDIAPHWPNADGHVAYHVRIEGVPDIDNMMTLSVRDPAKAGISGMPGGAGGMVATAMRVVNAIPYVVEARPGLLSSLDLPLTVPRQAFDWTA